MRISILSLGLALLASGAGGEASQVEAAPKLDVTVVLEADSLRASSRLPFRIWIANPTGPEVAAIDFRLEGPSFITLAEGTDRRLALGPLPPHQTLRRVLHLETPKEIVEGTFNLLFVVEHRRPASGEGEYAAYQAIEKPIQVGLLGTGSVGGFSFQLAALVVPGLLLLAPLRRWYPLVKGLDKGEAAALTVLSSAGLLWAAKTAFPTDSPEGISLERLLALCLAGFVLGTVTCIRPWYRKRFVLLEESHSTQQRLRRLLRSRSTLRRLLGRRSDERYNTVIQLVDGTRLCGSRIGAMAEGYMLGGWFEVRNAKGDERDTLDGLVREKRWRDVLESVRKSHLDLEPAEFIRRWRDGKWRPSTEDGAWKILPKKDVQEKHRTQQEGEEPRLEPLRIA